MPLAVACSVAVRRLEPATLADTPGAAGSLVLRRMDRRAAQDRGLVQTKKHGTKTGTGVPLRRGFCFFLSRATIGSWKGNK